MVNRVRRAVIIFYSCMYGCMFCMLLFFFCGAATQRGSWLPHSRGFLDHTRRRTIAGRTPLEEWSARRRDLYLTTPDSHNRQISIPYGLYRASISVQGWPLPLPLPLPSWFIGSAKLFGVLRRVVKCRDICHLVRLIEITNTWDNRQY